MIQVYLDNDEIVWVNPKMIVAVFARDEMNHAGISLINRNTIFTTTPVNQLVEMIHEHESNSK